MSQIRGNESRLPVLLWSLACAVIVIAVVAGLMITGGPAAQRQKRMDERRVSDLSSLRNAIGDYEENRKALPSSLADLEIVEPDYERFSRDPMTGQPYAYRVVDAETFELCAVFETNARQERSWEDRPYHHPMYQDDDRLTHHGAGRQCFLGRRAATDGERSSYHPRFRFVRE